MMSIDWTTTYTINDGIARLHHSLTLMPDVLLDIMADYARDISFLNHVRSPEVRTLIWIDGDRDTIEPRYIDNGDVMTKMAGIGFWRSNGMLVCMSRWFYIDDIELWDFACGVASPTIEHTLRHGIEDPTMFTEAIDTIRMELRRRIEIEGRA